MTSFIIFGSCVLHELSWDSKEYQEEGHILAETKLKDLVKQYDTLEVWTHGDFTEFYDVVLATKCHTNRNGLVELLNNVNAWNDYRQVLQQIGLEYLEPDMRIVTTPD